MQRLLLLLALLAITACATTPQASPAAGLATVDLVTITTPQNATAPREGFQSRDLARIRAILEIIRGAGDWDGTWHTFPAGKVHIAFQSGDRILGAAWIGEGYLVARADSTTKMRSITRAEYDSLLKLTVWWPPTTADYATFDTLTGPPAPLDYSVDADARRFRSQLEGAKFANLAGHFAVVTWGCGTECWSHMVLDLRSGRPYTDTLLHLGCHEVAPERGSALVIATPAPWSGGACRQVTRYLVWEGERFRELATPWLLDDTIAMATQRGAATAADSALVERARARVVAIDADLHSRHVEGPFFARLESGEVVPVQDFQDPPEGTAVMYEIGRAQDGTIVRASETPTSMSGDGAVVLTHYFDPDGTTIAVEQYVGMIEGCLLPPAEEGGEEVATSTSETAIWLFDPEGRTIAKSYKRVGGEDQRDLTNANNCRTDQQFRFDKYRTRSTWLAVAGLAAALRSAH